MSRAFPADACIKLGGSDKAVRYHLRHDGALFSTPATSLEQAKQLGADEFSEDDPDDFVGVECPDCGVSGRSYWLHVMDQWECAECGHLFDGPARFVGGDDA